MRSPIVLAILGFAIWGTVSVGLAQSPENGCLSCHDDEGKKVAASTHGELGCSTCHEKHEDYPHPAGVPKPACSQCHSDVAAQYSRSAHGQAARQGNAAAPDCTMCHGSAHEAKPASSAEFHKAVPDTCGMCHTEPAEQFRASVHGAAVARGVTAAPVCTTCHGEHSILAKSNEASPVNAAHIRETCGQCHANLQLSKRFGLPTDRIVSFDASFHGLAARAGSQSVANCASCHGFHNVLASSDPKSSIHPRNLPQTCGRCHEGAGRRFALGPIHQLPGNGEPEGVKWVRLAYSILIPLTIGFMLLHNLGDWTRKLFALRFKPVRRALAPHGVKREIRMYGFERFQHALTALSFIVLVWTGFALKYPDHWWARPLVVWESSFPVRGVIHRIAAVVLMGIAVVHAVSLIVSRRLRRHWKELWPRRQDVPEALMNFSYNLGVLSRRPPISSHSYIEKAEYWAVVWGTAIMGATGIMLWANNWMLRYLPKSIIDIATSIHLYEAILATLAIVVWHFYSVIFDPDVYPLETAFLNGVSVKDHGKKPPEEEKARGAAAESKSK
jgi:cytochrome b subunit of formate dehydrogenase